MIVDAIVSVGSMIAPPIFDFIKKKFLPVNKDSVEATLSTLATTKPDILSSYIEANTKFLEAKSKYFNREIVGDVSRWVRNLRAAIRPIYVICAVLYFFMASNFNWHVDPCIKYSMEVCISSWFGSRISKT